MRPRIVVIGSANTDMVVHIAHLPTAGETVIGGRFISVQGGKGANQAVAAARLGADVTFVACLGRDALGQANLAAYHAEGINLDYIALDEASSSGVALIMVDQKGENCIAVASGANASLSTDDVEKAMPAIQKADCVLLQLEIPLETVMDAVNLAKELHVPVVLNPAPAMPIPQELLRKIDVLTPNENEAGLLAGWAEPVNISAAAQLLYERSGVKDLVVSLGRQGALIAGPDGCIVPGFNVETIDTTGAGDAFNAGLTVALARGLQLEKAVRYANAVGALATTRMGAQPSLPTAEQVEDFLEKNLVPD